MGSDKKTIEDRLTELLEAKDEEIAELEQKIEELTVDLKTAEHGWLVHAVLSPEQVLPVPRLEIEIVGTGRYEDMKWYTREYRYRMVYRATWGEVIAIPLGHTTSQGGGPGQERPVYKDGPHVGKPYMPHRDGAHICNDMAQLKLPGFLICEEVVGDISHLAGKPEARW